jgi:predicted secreted protein
MQNHISKVLVVSHCLLNKSTRWWQVGKPPERNIGLAAEIIEYALKRGLGLLQMPCPEFTFCGNPRPPRTKKEYEALPGFKEYCGRLARIVADQIKAFITMSEKPRIRVVAIIGVKRSPSCAVSSAIIGKDGFQRYDGKGIFIEVLEKEIKESLNVPFLEFDFDNPSAVVADLEKLIKVET